MKPPEFNLNDQPGTHNYELYYTSVEATLLSDPQNWQQFVELREEKKPYYRLFHRGIRCGQSRYATYEKVAELPRYTLLVFPNDLRDLETLYRAFQNDPPVGLEKPHLLYHLFRSPKRLRSLSAGDVLYDPAIKVAYFCDSLGWKVVPNAG